MEKLYEFVEKYWLKPKSSIFVAILLVLAYVGGISALNSWKIITLNSKRLVVMAILVFVVWSAYTIIYFVKNRLEKAPKDSVAVLFCIDAENEKLFEAAKYKLVNNFNSSIADVGDIHFRAICISKDRLYKYDLQKKSDALSLLQRTNCIILVCVRYTADDVDNAETFELKIDYGVRHPKFDEASTKMLTHDMSALNAPIKNRKFTKGDTLDVFNFTTQALVCVCQYILGVISLLSGNSNIAYKLLSQARTNSITDYPNICSISGLDKVIDDRIFTSLTHLASESMMRFQNDKHMYDLIEMRRILQEANTIYPDTYFYNINMAYAHIIVDRNVELARKCIKRCKQLRNNTDWMYSEAFLSAYLNHAPGTIFSKYKKAFANSYKSLSEIVEYIEFVIDREPDRTSLHLAAALVYEEMGDSKLMKQHFCVYAESTRSLDRRTKERIDSKINGTSCEIACDHNCRHCSNLIA